MAAPSDYPLLSLKPCCKSLGIEVWGEARSQLRTIESLVPYSALQYWAIRGAVQIRFHVCLVLQYYLRCSGLIKYVKWLLAKSYHVARCDDGVLTPLYWQFEPTPHAHLIPNGGSGCNQHCILFCDLLIHAVLTFDLFLLDLKKTPLLPDQLDYSSHGNEADHTDRRGSLGVHSLRRPGLWLSPGGLQGNQYSQSDCQFLKMTYNS